MIATLTLADMQIQIGATLILLVVTSAISFVLGRISVAPVVLDADEQAEIDRIESEINASFRGQHEDEIYTEHSPQITTCGPYGDRWREVED